MPSPWTTPLAQKAAALWPKQSAGQIREILHKENRILFSRSAIIAKMQGMGLTKGRPGKVVATKPRKVATAKPARAARIAPPISKRKPPSLPPLRVVEVLPLHLTLHDLTDATCKYECSGREDVALFTFCGNKTETGSPYCAAHARLCIVAPIARRRAA